MNYYEFLYRWNVFEYGEEYHFNCYGIPCGICSCFVERDCLLRKYHYYGKYPTNWNMLHTIADQLLTEGVLYK